jgi:hypothetical protein
MAAQTSHQRSSKKLSKLRTFADGVKARFHTSHGQASTWLAERSIQVDEFRTKSQQLLAATSLAGTMALQNMPVDAQVFQRVAEQTDDKAHELMLAVTEEERVAILQKLASVVQQAPGKLDREQELYLEQQLSDMLGFTVTAELEGNRLNHTIGIMGGEQHLKRFPTDDLSQHDAYQESGMAAGRGAFGWFTENGVLTEQAIQREKYYFAVQTLYLPNWNSDWKHLKTWYAFRKMIVINPAEQVAVVGVVGDAGPAQWVKKQFGGSPEVIREGKIWSPRSRGKVYLLFVDDPADKVPLGVIHLDQLTKTLAQPEVKTREKS